MSKTLEDLKALVEPCDAYQLECDGMTQAIAYVLKQAGYTFRGFFGLVASSRQDVPAHYWLEVEVEGRTYTVDLRLRMWLSYSLELEEIPHGVFLQQDYPRVEYNYRGELEDPVPPADLFYILTN